MTDELTPFMTLADTAELIRTRRVSPVEVAEFHLARIESIDSSINSFFTVTADKALEQAREAERDIAGGNYRGPLHGIPFSVKDMFMTAGVRTTTGSFILENWIPEFDATPVRNLLDDGAVLLGKVATLECGTGAPDEGPFPAPRNPWNAEYSPAGSSNGSGASIGAGMGLLSLGSDTGGSIRIPASFAGVVGLRGTYGRVSRWGHVALSWSQDVAGPIARTVLDTALAYNALSGYDPRDPASADLPVPDFTERLGHGVGGLRIGVDEAHFFDDGLDEDVKVAVWAALRTLEDLGAKIKKIDLPTVASSHDAQNLIHSSETHAYHRERITTTPEKYGPTIRSYLRNGALIPAFDYLNAQRIRNRVRTEISRALRDEVDIIASPTTPRAGVKLTDFTTKKRMKPGGAHLAHMTNPFSQAGVPAISIPCGFSEYGMPMGFQLVGRAFDESTVFQAAAAYERETPWHAMHPDI